MDVVISASITTLIALLGYVPQKRKLKGLQTAIQLDEKSIAGI